MSAPLAKYFVAVLTNKIELLPETIKRLEKYFGKANFTSPWFDFTYTNFYEKEMGKNLKRCLVSFEKPLPTLLLTKAKKWTTNVEGKFRQAGKRQVNIDAGYMDFCKVVLASGKHGGHKIALTNECFADMILDYQNGSFHPFAWTFPDFASGAYNTPLLKIRTLFKDTIKGPLLTL